MRSSARVRRWIPSKGSSRLPILALPQVSQSVRLRRPRPFLLQPQWLQSRRRRSRLRNSSSCNCNRIINFCRLPHSSNPQPLNIRSVTRFRSSRSLRRQMLRTSSNSCNSFPPTSCPSSCKRCLRTLLRSPCLCSTLPCSPSLFSEQKASKIWDTLVDAKFTNVPSSKYLAVGLVQRRRPRCYYTNCLTIGKTDYAVDEAIQRIPHQTHPFLSSIILTIR